MCPPQKRGGLGIHDLRKLNLSLLGKWWWKLEKEECIWQDIVKNKYIKNKLISQLKHKPGNSQVWNDILKIKDLYKKGCSTTVGNGKHIDFWQDR